MTVPLVSLHELISLADQLHPTDERQRRLAAVTEWMVHPVVYKRLKKAFDERARDRQGANPPTTPPVRSLCEVQITVNQYLDPKHVLGRPSQLPNETFADWARRWVILEVGE